MVTTKSASGTTDIAVVGAGVGGSYAAWRLKTAYGNERSVTLFEHGERVGGRLYTRWMPGMPHVPVELGGMRYMSTQKLVAGVIGQLCGLTPRKFPMGNPDPAIGRDHNLVYVRGQHLKVKDLRDSSKVPYTVATVERGKNPTDLQIYAMNQLVPNAGELSLEQWFDVEVFGEPLYKFGFWNLLDRVLTGEAYSFMKDAGGYDANVANANSVYQLPATEYGATDVEYLALREGYQRLPERLVEAFCDAPGQGTFEPNRRLAAIERRADGQYELVFVQTSTTGDRTCDAAGAEPQRVTAKQVILAMPRRSLELVEWRCWNDDAWLREHLASVLVQPALKLLFGYERPWWRELGLYAGRSITDLPVRQIYYFETEGEQEGADPANTNSLLDASYNDLHTVAFWRGLERGAAFEGYPAQHLGPSEAPVPSSARPATRSMVDAAQRQLELVHGESGLPPPYSALYHDWSDDPYGGGWHEWKAGFRYDHVIKRMRHPVASENVYICGEAYSKDQGWVEGALETSELALQESFGLERPSWLDADYDIGP